MICLGLLLQFPPGCSDSARKNAAEGDSFPLQMLNELSLISDRRPSLDGKTLLINFWATWCAPCRREMPDLQRLSDGLDPERYAVIGISVDKDVNLVREFLLQYQIRFPIYLDAGKHLAVERLGINSYPQTFVVSPAGVIAQRIDKPISWDPSRLGQSAGTQGTDRFDSAQAEPGR